MDNQDCINDQMQRLSINNQSDRPPINDARQMPPNDARQMPPNDARQMPPNDARPMPPNDAQRSRGGSRGGFMQRGRGGYGRGGGAPNDARQMPNESRGGFIQRGRGRGGSGGRGRGGDMGARGGRGGHEGDGDFTRGRGMRGMRGRGMGRGRGGRGDSYRGRGGHEGYRDFTRGGRGGGITRGGGRGGMTRGRGFGRGRGGRGGRGFGDPRYRGRGERGGRGFRGRGGGFGRGRGRGRGDVDRPPKSTKTWCCNDGDGKEKSGYFELYEKGELNPSLLEPRLVTCALFHNHSRIAPDRRGVSHFHLRTFGFDAIKVGQCIADMSSFIRKHSNIGTPVRITCRVSHIEADRMHMHLHYERPDWIQIIEEEEKLNIYAEDIADKDALHSLFCIVDIFKHFYAKQGNVYHIQNLMTLGNVDTATKENENNAVNANENENPNENENERKERNNEEMDIEKIRSVIKKEEFRFSNTECRVWKKFANDQEISLEREISSAFKMANTLKHLCDFNLCFEHQRFGLDFESRSVFVEIRPTGYNMLFDGKWKKFCKKYKSTMKARSQNTEKKLKKEYTESKVREVGDYAAKFFQNHPEIFAWHQTRH